jgi:hypothetical protein
VPRTVCSASIVLVASIFTAEYFPGVVVAHEAARANPAQAKPAAPATVVACSLLTKQDAAAALGEAVTGPKSTSGASLEAGMAASSCEYSGSGLHKVHLNLQQLSPATAAMYKAFCAEKKKDGLSGLGDVACWYNDKHEELQVLKGTTFFSVELRRSGDPTEAIKGVAKKVFDQLR